MFQFNETEQEEREYLKEIQRKLKVDADKLEKRFNNRYDEVLEHKRFLRENEAHIDGIEKTEINKLVNEGIDKGEADMKLRNKRLKQIQSPYFARIDFCEDGEYDEALYIGVNSFIDPEEEDIYIYDWRSPVASLYYNNFDGGRAEYESPVRTISGEITRKRQYRIREGEMQYMIESLMTVDDDILQKELRSNSGERMKNIVATIQQEQNKIIRNDSAAVLIIQGVAGSGKTSIALHRVAYLLYRYNGTLKSENFMIISPNIVFSDYISGVLPELGEDNINEVCMDGLANIILNDRYSFQTFFEQVEYLLNEKDSEVRERIRFKSSLGFCFRLNEFIKYANDEFFQPEDLELGDYSLTAEEIKEIYLSKNGSSIKERLKKTITQIIADFNKKSEEPMEDYMVSDVHKSVKAMYIYRNPLNLYREFYKYIGREDMIKSTRDNRLEYSDLFPLAYIKLAIDGDKGTFSDIKHLLIDEMQDYTPIQYAVISKVFHCHMTILGDGCQSVNPYSSTYVEKIQPFFERCSCVELNNSYRSTYEILEFAKRIINNEKLIPMERHGDEPELIACGSVSEQFDRIKAAVEEFKKSDFTSMGIICKSMKQAKTYYRCLSAVYKDVTLLDFESDKFENGIVVTSTHLSKGLEFDRVVLPDASAENYSTEMDRGLLYIGCTRAMHKLDLLYSEERTKLIAD